MFTHTDHCHGMKVSYFEASQRVSCNRVTHLGWLITDASQRWVSIAWCMSIPSNKNKFSTLTTMFAERLPIFQLQSTSK